MNSESSHPSLFLLFPLTLMLSIANVFLIQLALLIQIGTPLRLPESIVAPENVKICWLLGIVMIPFTCSNFGKLYRCATDSDDYC